MKYPAALICALILFALTAQFAVARQAPPVDGLRYQVFLIGDAGGVETSQDPILRALSSSLHRAGEESAVVFLGDNIYCCGLPDSAAAGREVALRRLHAQLDAVKDIPGRVFFIPGNHDWDRSGDDGLAAVNRQERYVEAFLDKGNSFRPDDGFPGPETVKLAKGITLVTIDTEWWLRDSGKSFGDGGEYDINEEADFVGAVADVLRRKDNDDLIFVAHHPLRSNGTHAGRASLKDHIFPLTQLWPNAFVPLPVLGSAVPLIRSWFGGRQDLSNWKYRSLIGSLESLFLLHEENLVYASGHDHSLQHFPEGQVHHVISGAGSRDRLSYVASGRGAAFSQSSAGFMELRYYDDGAVWLAARLVAEDGQLSTPYSTRIKEPSDIPADLPLGGGPTDVSLEDSTYTGAIAPELKGSRLRRALLGSAHRDAWSTPVTVPLFDIGRVEGGLTPLKRGGGLQTVSLRLENADGQQFVLRSLTKNPVKTLPKEFQETYARDIFLDQVSVLHPFGALMVPPLADAAGVYHTSPSIYYVPDDPRFGRYAADMAGRFMQLEERPNDDMSAFSAFGNSEEVVGASDLFHEINSDNDHRVDQAFFARSRLFDMFLSDWDRHQDQWRWATIEPEDGQGKIYRPIPRDRDWAFNRMNGFFPSITKSELVLPKFQDFRHKYGFLPGLNLNGMPQDRRFTASLSRADWIAIGEDMRESISNESIEEALSRLPPEIAPLYVDQYRGFFDIRRALLPVVAEGYYEVLAKYVDVIGSDKHEEFEITRPSADRTLVVVYKTSKEGERRHEIFRREFLAEETHEIRLYGFGGQDRFNIEGAAPGIRTYIVGGTGSDQVVDKSEARFRHGPVYVMDTPGGLTLESGSTTRDRRSRDPAINRYDQSDYRFNYTAPRIFFGANEDDGVFIGGGASFDRHRFRKMPFARRHVFLANVSAKTQAFNAIYSGTFTEAIGSWDLLLDAEARTPNNIRNFFGLGNERPNNRESAEFYQTRLSRYGASIQFKQTVGSSAFSIGPFLTMTDIQDDIDRFASQPDAGVAPASFEDHTYAGVSAEIKADMRDHAVYPRHGALWEISARLNGALTDGVPTYGDLRGSLSLFASRGDRFTVGLRVGGGRNVGDFPFFGAQTLGGRENLRGWRSTRFAGRSAFYQNLDLRIRLARYQSLLAVGEAGLLLFADNGRVWTDGENSRAWHQGAGAGLWTNLFDIAVLSATLGFSEEQETFAFGIGFLY